MLYIFTSEDGRNKCFVYFFSEVFNRVSSFPTSLLTLSKFSANVSCTFCNNSLFPFSVDTKTACDDSSSAMLLLELLAVIRK